MKTIKKYEDFCNEGLFSKDKNPEVEAIEIKIADAAYSLQTLGAMTKQAAFINGAKWAIHNLSDSEIEILRKNTSKDDFSFFGL
jgi:hypothetical protein